MSRSAVPYSATSQPRRTPSRRAVAGGALWAVPVVTLAATAPAVAASTDPVIITVNGNGSTGGPTTIQEINFTCARTVSYTVQGGAGGSASAGGGGAGAKLTGTILVPAGVKLTLIGGGVGDPTTEAVPPNFVNTVSPQGGKGYGNGGSTLSTCRAGGGGGGGSAILITSGGTTSALVVAGGGGGRSIRNIQNAGGSGNTVQPAQVNNAGSALVNGGKAPDLYVDWTVAATGAILDHVFVPGAPGASGLTPGVATTPTAQNLIKPAGGTFGNGVAAGSNGTASSGATGGNGGNGGTGVAPTNLPVSRAASGGGGGGGYAGGAGGGSGAAWRTVSVYPESIAQGGGGGAGSSYAASAAVSGATVSNTTTTTATTFSNGYVTISLLAC